MKHKDIPYLYLHCFADKKQCARCEQCLHSYVTQFPDEELSPAMTVHPLYIEGVVAKGKECRHFREIRKETYARGFKKLCDRLPRNVAYSAEHRIRGLFNSRTSYYRARRGESMLDEHMQRRIKALLGNLWTEHGLQFDEYDESYHW